MRLFESSLNDFENYLGRFEKAEGNVEMAKGFSNSSRQLARVDESSTKTDVEEAKKSPRIFEFDESSLRQYFSPSPLRFDEISIGAHPDFKTLAMDDTLKHYAVSMFIDIKGSTRLIDVVDSLEELRRIKDSILTLAIHVVNYFGGHVQRLQGDGVFVLFCRKEEHPNDAIVGAINASTVLSHFISNDFADVVKRMGVEKSISIRTGIDFGPESEVLWSHYGIPGCEELTTTSLHTDLAAKLQQRAPKNGVILGKNVVEALDFNQDFLNKREVTIDGVLKVDSAINVSQSISYPFLVFNWEKYLLSSFSFTCKNSDGKVEFSRPTKRLKCTILSSGLEYPENCYALEKNLELQFSIIDSTGNPFNNYPRKKIKWEIVNTGTEANDADKVKLSPAVLDEYSTEATANSAYLGHHKMICRVDPHGVKPETIEFSVFVRPSYDRLLKS